ncbi:cell wall-binding repeat-containing protein [Clostridium tetani]|nr:cell wall-binding repeat-containing protein [Clostridium tetani]
MTMGERYAIFISIMIINIIIDINIGKGKGRKMNSKKIISFIMTTMIMCSTTVLAESKSEFKRKRIYGSNRYETSIMVSKEGWDKSSYAVISRGDNFADALCAVPLSKKYNAPILLIGKDKLNNNLKSELKRLNVSKVFITGGEGVISKTLEGEIKNIPNIKEVKRLGGKDRYETSKLIAESVGCNGEIVVTAGTNSSDTLSISPIAANKNMPILLTAKDKNLMEKYLKSNKVNKTFVIGGEKCVSKEIENILPNVERIYGENRYETNEKIIKRFSNSLDFKNVYIALAQSQRGDEFADALSSAALAAQKNSPIILIYKDIYKNTKDILNTKLSNESIVSILGGEKLISDNILDNLAISKNLQTKDKDNKSSGSSSTSSSSSSTKPSKKDTEYKVIVEPSFPGAFTYDLKVIGDNGETLKGYKLLYDGDIIAEDEDNDGMVRILTIFFGKDSDKAKFKIVKGEKEISFTGLK